MNPLASFIQILSYFYALDQAWAGFLTLAVWSYVRIFVLPKRSDHE